MQCLLIKSNIENQNMVSNKNRLKNKTTQDCQVSFSIFSVEKEALFYVFKSFCLSKETSVKLYFICLYLFQQILNQFILSMLIL